MPNDDEEESSTLHLESSSDAGVHNNATGRPGSSLLAATANLLNTVVGGGILSLPFAFKTCGLAAGALYQVLFGAASWYGSYLLLDALRYRPTASSYEALALASLGPKGALAYNAAALINCYGACVSYLVAVADVIPPLLAEMGHDVGRSVVLLLLTALVIFPLSALRDISALRYASGLAVLIYIAFAITLGYLGFTAPPAAAPAAPLFKPDPAGWISAIPLCAFAFVHQTSIFPIYQEVREPTPMRMRAVVSAAVVTATCLYLFASLAAYARFGERTRGDILLNLATVDSDGVRLMRLAFGFSVCLTYPCLHFAARRALDQLLFSRQRQSSAADFSWQRQSSAGDDAGRDTPYPRLLGLTGLLVGSSLCIALAVDRVEVIFGFTGAVASTMLSYVLPAAIHLMLRPHRVSSWRKNGGTAAFMVAGVAFGLVALVNHTVDTFS
jgi:amino acid permease